MIYHIQHPRFVYTVLIRLAGRVQFAHSPIPCYRTSWPAIQLIKMSQQDSVTEMFLFEGDTPDRPEWHLMKYCSREYTLHMPWADLVVEAQKAYDWVHQQPGAWTRGGHMSGSCLVAALFIPRPLGGYMFFSTIGRGARANELLIPSNRSTWAPAWLAANDSRPTAIHCEDGAIFDFERFNMTLAENDARKVKMTRGNDGYAQYAAFDEYGRRHYKLQIAIYGAKIGVNSAGLQLPCGPGDPMSRPKAPPCEEVLTRLGIEWCTHEHLQAELVLNEQGGVLFSNPPGGGSGSAGTGNGGGASGGGSGTGIGGGTGHGGTGYSGTGYSGTAHGGTGYSGTGQESRPAQGGSKAAHASKTAGKPHTHSTTSLGHGGKHTSDSSYNIADHMSELSISTGQPSASVPKQGGHSKGKVSNDVVAAFQAIDTEHFDDSGNPAYWGTISDKSGKRTVRVSVNAYGLVSGQSRYFCFDSDGNVFTTPPEVSKEDPTPQKSEKLQKLARKLYSGKMAAAPSLPGYHEAHHDLPTQNDHAAYGHTGDAYTAHNNASGYHDYDRNISYRPSTASSGGSSGEYTTRPPSRGSATGPAGHAPVPRTAAHDHHLATHQYGQASRPPSRNGTTGYAGHGSAPRAAAYDNSAPASRPSSRGSSTGQAPPHIPKSGPAAGGPSKPPAAASKPAAAQGAPTLPRKVKLDSAKINGTFTVHGTSKGKPFLKGVNAKKPDDHHSVSYSKKNNKFYIEGKNERIYLTGV